MRSQRRAQFALCVALLAVAAFPSAVPAAPLFPDGPSGRHLLELGWYDRPDPAGTGTREGFQTSPSLTGWRAASIPMAANAGDFSLASYTGSVHWYRNDFVLPRGGRDAKWFFRFESVNYRAKAWLNGRLLGTHVGAYLPFELAAGRPRKGTNHLVVRVDSRRRADDIPPLSVRANGGFEGGWWNYNGILREVYLRKVRKADISYAFVKPRLPCRSCTATVRIDARVANLTPRALRARLAGTFGGRPLRFRERRIRGRHGAIFSTRFRVRNPRLWEPRHPRLYNLHLKVLDDRGRALQRYRAHAGIRSVRVNRLGRIVLNGREVNLRGAAIHEDSLDRGAALTRGQMQQTFRNLRDLGATITRAHYPLSPYELALADRYGIIVWSEIPVYRMKSTLFNIRRTRIKALRMLRAEVARDFNHPSVMVWSIGNENASRPKRGFRRYIREAVKTVRRMDKTRLTGIAVSGYPTVEKQQIYLKLDVIGLNDYFGWYPGPGGSIADRGALSGYLDRMHSDYPHQAFIITEVGAEANRHGLPTEKGTYEFQADFLAYHLAVLAKKPFINSVIIWALHDFRVKPGWAGGNPFPHPPVNEKGLIDDSGFRKPAFDTVRKIFDSTRVFR